ncbi:L-rhamnose-binding lectin CSL3-like [Misgurnus anguillicaudatus]|uniref:L-rhamnose-binding lectin CSL3-like n=1 Tax=Misgurnus anguillicaudatus TaxID=75329 RepID=UPI003CCF6AA8
MQQERLSLIFLLVILCWRGVKAVDLTACEGETAQLTCDLTSQVIACDSDIASLHCDQGHIKVLSANYGRTNSATCSGGKPANQISNVQCTQDSSLNVLASRCDGRKDCSIPAISTVFGDPCVGTYKYLNVSYICIPSSAIIQKRTTCEGDTVSINCNNRFIKVLSANYGRTNSATCSTGKPSNQISNVQCTQSSSLSVLANRCDGIHACSVYASSTVFGDPCSYIFKYLNVSYICHPNNQFIKVSAANFGRTNGTTCSTGKPADQISNVQCSQSSSLSVLNTQCDGLKDCSVPASSTVFGDPCLGTYKYLNVSYTCGPDPSSLT